MSLKKYINEAKIINAKEDNPMIYTLVIAKLQKKDKDELKEDKEFMDLLSFVDKMIEKLDCKMLKKSFSPISMFNTFGLETTKKMMKDYIKQYFNEFETIIADNENTFENAYKVHKMFQELYENDLWTNFINNI